MLLFPELDTPFKKMMRPLRLAVKTTSGIVASGRHINHSTEGEHVRQMTAACQVESSRERVVSSL